MVGGKVIQLYQLPDRPGITWINTYDPREEPCSVLGEIGDAPVRLGDSIWWQGGSIMWTPVDRSKVDVKFKKVGGSGVNHPLGKEYEIRYDFESLYRKTKESLLEVRDLLEKTRVSLSVLPFDGKVIADIIRSLEKELKNPNLATVLEQHIESLSVTLIQSKEKEKTLNQENRELQRQLAVYNRG